jgi:hypothetical protein
MTALEQIGNFFKSIQGVLTCVIVAGGIVSSVLLRHDAKVRMDFVKSNKTINILSVDSIVKLRVSPVTKQIETVIANQVSFDNRLKRDSIARDVFQNNYSHLLWDKFGSEWMKYMSGMQITVVQEPYMPTKSIEEQKSVFKMRIEKIDTTKKK